MNSELIRIFTKYYISKFSSSFFRYAVVGGFLLAVDFLIVILLMEQLKMHAVISQILGRASGMVLGYFLHQRFTFPLDSDNLERRISLRYIKFGYLAIGMLTTAMSPFFFVFLLTSLNGWLIGAKLISDAFLVLLTFILNSILFSTSEPSK